jgi:hypothetical protein
MSAEMARIVVIPGDTRPCKSVSRRPEGNFRSVEKSVTAGTIYVAAQPNAKPETASYEPSYKFLWLGTG